MRTFRPRFWRWSDARRGTVVAGLVVVLTVLGGEFSMTAAGVIVFIVAALFYPDSKTLSIGQDLVTLMSRSPFSRKPRWSSATVRKIVSIRLQPGDGRFCDQAGRRLLSVGSGWTTEQFLAIAEQLQVPLYDRRERWRADRAKEGRLIYEPGH